MKSISLFFCVAAAMLMSASCKKGNNEPDTAQPTPFSFVSLTADTTEIVFSINPSTKITAVATGDGLKYYWSASAGDILGSGEKVTYTATPGCCGGYNTVTCKVKDKYGNVDAKQVSINVRN
jgi:hypothetical protein